MSKICTMREQSQKLIELGIDANTADMWYDVGLGTYPSNIPQVKFNNDDKFIDCYYLYPAWSLTALLGLMPKLYDEDDLNDGGCQPVLCKGFDNNMWHVIYRATWYGTDWYCEPIDAAFDMVCWLLENKKI